MKRFTILAGTVVGLLSWFQPAMASIVETPGFPAFNYPISGFGEGSAVETVGQTVTVPFGEAVLNSFAFSIGNASANSGYLQAYVASWTGVAVDTVLWSSSSFEVPVSGFNTYSFTPGLTLTEGNQYVLFLSSLAVHDSVSEDLTVAAFADVSNPYLGGSGFSSAVSSIGSLTFPWDPLTDVLGSDFAFSASFSAAPSGVPEPSSMALMGLGMGIVGLIRCRRSKKAAVDSQAV